MYMYMYSVPVQSCGEKQPVCALDQWVNSEFHHATKCTTKDSDLHSIVFQYNEVASKYV